MKNTQLHSASVDSYFDKVFYINLEKDTVRDKNMIVQFKKFGITNYERVEAIQLTEFPSIDKYRNFIKNDSKYILGSLSCKASHIKTVKVAQERNYKAILILEDDVLMLDDPAKLIAQNISTMGEWDMLYFGGLIEPHFRNQIVGAYAYAIKNTLFDDIICMAEPSGMEIDNFYAKIIQHMSYNYNHSGKYDVRIIRPFNKIMHDNSLDSNIQKR